MKKIIKRIFIVLLFALPFQSFAWGLFGHRIVGEIASKYLTPAAKAAVIKILGTETMAMASNYPDFIKSDSNYNYLYNWHYINFRGGLSRQQVDSVLAIDTASNAYTRINQIVKQLKSKKLT